MARFALDQRGMTNGAIGAAGPAGGPGASGAGAVFTSVDSLHASPRAVTDWGPTLNTAISGGTKHFVFGPFDYPISTQVSLNSSVSVVFQGTSGLVWPANPGNKPSSRLIWQGGAGSGVAVSLVAADSFQAYDLAFCYLHASGYDGDLISHKRSSNPPSAFCKMERCYFGSDNPGDTTKTANCLVNLSTSVDAKFEHCAFENAQTPIRGLDDIAQDFSTDTNFDNCMFSTWVKAAVCNPTINWRFTACTFEYGDTASVCAFDSDTGTSVTPLISSVVIEDCYFWDGAASTQFVFNQRVGQQLILDVRGCYYDLIGATVPTYKLNGPGSFKLFGGNWVAGAAPYVDLGSATTAFKDQVLIDYPNWYGNGAKVLNIDGHQVVNIHGLRYPSNSQPSQQLLTVSGAVRAGHSSPPPTIALHGTPAGVSAVSIGGTDHAGMLWIIFTGSVTAGELIADITFGSSLSPGNWANLGASVWRVPTVVLTPLTISGNVSGGNTNAIAPAAFASVADHSGPTPANQTGWTLGLVNAGNLSGQNLAWSYLVIEI